MIENSAAAPIGVLIADDHPVVRMGLEALVSDASSMCVVAEAASGEEAVELVLLHRPDVVLMDLRMPGIGGVEAIQRICSVWPDTPRAALLETIEAVHHGQTSIPPEVAGKLAERLGGPELTERELEVLRRIVAGRSNKEIAADLSVSEGTVKFHVNNVLGKLGVAARTQAATEAIRRGIVTLV